MDRVDRLVILLSPGPGRGSDGGLTVRSRRTPSCYDSGTMAKLTSEIEVLCPCCGSTLTIDLHLRRVIAHREPEKGIRPELTDAQRILAEEAARREAIF